MRVITILFPAILTLTSISPSMAGGLLGDLINNVAPGVGTALDDAHRQVKNAVPPYKAIEEGATHVVNEAFVQSGAPALIELIARSRDDALRNGVDAIPPDIRANLTGFIPENILNAVRYRVGGGGDLTLQVNAIRYGEAAAITLDYVVVFKEQNDALYNPTLWAHELTHVGQYQSWGIHDFAVRYLAAMPMSNDPPTKPKLVMRPGLRRVMQIKSGSPMVPLTQTRSITRFLNLLERASRTSAARAGVPHQHGVPAGADSGQTARTENQVQ